MALNVGDRAKQTSTTTGTGTLTLNGKDLTGFTNFRTYLADADTTYYTITDGTDWEVGIGTFGHSGNGAEADTLARSDANVYRSTNSNDRVNWGSGTRSVFITQPSDKAVYLDGDGDLTLTGASYNVLWDRSANRLVFDNGGILSWKSPDYIFASITQTGTEFNMASSSGHMTISNTHANKYIKLSTVTGGDIVFSPEGTDALTVANDGDVTLTGASYNVVWDKSDNALEFADQAKLDFGAGDFKIYHYANSFIENYSGGLYIDQHADNSDIRLRADDSSGGLVDYFKADGSEGEALLYHYGTEKLATKSTGVEITGNLDINSGATNSLNLFIGDQIATPTAPTVATANVNGAVSGSTTLVVDGNSGTIEVNMTVTGTGVEEGVIVNTVTDQNNLVLNTAQTISNDVALTFTGKEGTQNTIVGTGLTGKAITTGYKNTIMGNNAGNALTSGFAHTLIGDDAGSGVSTSEHSTMIGWNAGQATNMSNSTLVGSQTWSWNSHGCAVGNYAWTGWLGAGIGYYSKTPDLGVAIGAYAGQVATTGGNDYSTFVGYASGQDSNSNTYNTFVGYEAGRYGANGHATSSTKNVAIGGYSLWYNNSAINNQNVAVGYAALFRAGGSADNVAIGHQSMRGNSANNSYITGDSNVALGTNTLYGLSGVDLSGNYNVALGRSAGYSMGAGNYNILIGANAGDSITSGSGNIIMGYSADSSSATAHGELVIRGHDNTNYVKWINGDNNSVTLNYNSSGTASAKLATTSTGVTVTGTVVADGFSVGDGEQVKVGASDDLTLTHTSGTSFIENDTGNLYITNTANDADTVMFCDDQQGANEVYLRLDGSEGEVQLSHVASGSSSVKLTTKSTGIEVTGTVIDDGATHDGDVTFTGANYNVVWDKSDNALEFGTGAKAAFGSSQAFRIFHTASNTYIDNTVGHMNLTQYANDCDIILFSDDGSGGTAEYVKCDGSTGIVYLYHYGNWKFNTNNDGVWVNGAIQLNNSDTTIARSAAGTVTIEGNKIKLAGKESMWIPANAMSPAATNPCSALTIVDSGGNSGPDLRVLDFATGSDEHAQFSVAMPKAWDGGNITYIVFWVGNASTDGVTWALQVKALGDGEDINVAFGTAVVVDDSAQNSASELLISPESGNIACSGADNDILYFQIFRDVSDAHDDMNADARLVGIKVFYTTDKVNDG